MRKVHIAPCILVIVLFSLSCHPPQTLPPSSIPSLQFLDLKVVPHRLSFQGTTVGGLSGIDYDANSHSCFLICDDRSALNPARFYRAAIDLNANRIDSVRFLEVEFLQTPSGGNYPGVTTDPLRTPDPEAIRYDAANDRLVWSSEGERIVSPQKTVLQDPGVYFIDRQGRFADSLQLPSNMHIRYTEEGPRQNGVFEGMSFGKNNEELFVSVEEPLFEDGRRAGTGDSSAWIRILRFDTKSRTNTAQYAYPIDPVAYPPTPAGAFRINGVPDILWLDDNRLLIMERSFSTGRKPCTIKIYLADLSGATDITGLRLNEASAGWHPITKKLILNMDSLGIYTDNIEGMTFGPRLSNGHRSLIMVADDNFSPEEQTQFLLFQID